MGLRGAGEGYMGKKEGMNRSIRGATARVKLWRGWRRRGGNRKLVGGGGQGGNGDGHWRQASPDEGGRNAITLRRHL